MKYWKYLRIVRSYFGIGKIEKIRIKKGLLGGLEGSKVIIEEVWELVNASIRERVFSKIN